MKKLFKKSKREHGAIALISVFVLMGAVLLMAFIIDGGLLYYKSAKLQNAVDAAAVGVAHHIGSSENTLEFYAEDYLDKNGFPKEKYGDKWEINIQKKNILNEAETIDDEEYVSSGMIRLNVKIEDHSLLGTFSGLDSLKLDKTGYAKANANYVRAPRALNFTIFGASGTNSDEGTVNLSGKTGDFENYVTGGFQEIINGINSKIVQPIIGIFGGTPNYNDLVHFNTSEIVTNGDVHSNSNIMIGVQALNASRVMDAEYNGTIRRNGADKSIIFGNSVENENNDYSDYGQVTFTAVNTGRGSRTITFNNTFSNSNNSNLTHLYVQNQHYLEQTQLVLNAINSIANFNSLGLSQDISIARTGTGPEGYTYSSTNNNGTVFLAGVERFLKGETQYYNKDTDSLTEKGKEVREIILSQAMAGNISVNDLGKLILNNQYMIVYDVDHKTARSLLDDVYNEGLSNVRLNAEQMVDVTNVFSGTSDSSNELQYDVNYTKPATQDNPASGLTAAVLGTRINRDLENVPSSITEKAQAGAKYALGMTFMENTEYVDVPNMKPYFVRQIKNSLYNATTQTHKDELGHIVYDEEGSTSVKKVVKQASENLERINNKTYYTDQTFANYNYDEHTSNIALDELEVASFNYKAAGEQLFSEYKKTPSSGITDLTKHSVTYNTTDWTMNDKGGMYSYADGTPKDRTWTVSSTTFKGYTIKNANGSLRNSSAFINDFANEYINADVTSKSQVLYGAKAIEQYKKYSVDVDDDHDDWNDGNGYIKSNLNSIKGDYQKHTGADAVAKKKAYLVNNISFDGVSSRYSGFINYAPEVRDVFLKGGSRVEERFDLAIDGIKLLFKSIEDSFTYQPSGTRKDTDVEEPTVADPDETGLVEGGSADRQITDPALNEKRFTFNKAISADGEFNGDSKDKEPNYYLENLFPGYDGAYGEDDYGTSTTVSYAINDFLSRHNTAPTITVNVPDPSTYTQDGNDWSENKQVQYGGNESDYKYNLANNTAFGTWDNPWYKRGAIGYDMGFRVANGYNVFFKHGIRLNQHNRQSITVGDNATVYIKDKNKCGGNKKASAETENSYYSYFNTKGSLSIGNNSTFYAEFGGISGGNISVGNNSTLYFGSHLGIKNDGTTWGGYDNSIEIGNYSNMYVNGAVSATGGSFKIGNNSKVYIGSSLDTNKSESTIGTDSVVYINGNWVPGDGNSDKNTTINSGAFVYVNGNIKVNNGNTLSVKSNAILVVTGELDASYINAEKGSIIYAGSINGGRDSATHYISNFLCPTNVTINGNLTLSENANVFINGNFTVGKTFTINSFDRIAIWGQPSFNSLAKGTTGVDNVGFYAYGDYGNSSFALEVPGNSSYCFNRFTASSVNIVGPSGQFCVTDSCTITGNVTNAGLAYLGNASISGKVDNKSDMHITGNLSPSSIENTGYLRVDGNISTTGEISSSGNGGLIVGGSVGSSDRKVSKFTNVGKSSIRGNLVVSGEIINGDPASPNTPSVLYVGQEGSSNVSVTGASLSNYYETRVQGVISVTGKVYNGGFLNATYQINCSELETKSNLRCELVNVNGNLNNSGTLLSRIITVTGTLTNGSESSGNATITANTSISVGNIAYSKNMYVAGNLTFTGSNTTFPAYNTYIMGSIVAGNGAASRPAITVGSIMKVEGGISASAFTMQEGTNAVINGTLSVYSPSGATEILNNGNLKVVGSISANGNNSAPATGTIAGNAAITNKNILQTVNLNCLTVVNNGEDINVKQATILATGYIKVTGDLTNGAPRHRTDVIYTREYLYVDGNILNYGQIGTNSADLNGNAITVTGDVVLYNTMSHPNGNILYGGTIDEHISDDVIYIAKDDNVRITRDSAQTLLANTKIIEVDGNLWISSDVTNEIEGLLISGGTVYCEARTLTLKYLNIEKTGTFSTSKASGLLGAHDVVVTDKISGSNLVSVKNDGYCYIDGDLTSSGAIETGGGELYVNGDTSVGSIAWYGTSALHMIDFSQIYIKGNFSTTTQNAITIDEASGSTASTRESVLSIYGGGHTSCFGTGQLVIQNDQPEASVYLGTGTDSTSEWKVRPITLTGQGELHNYGSMYVYGCFSNILGWRNDNNNATFKNSGGTYIAGYFNTDCNLVNVSNKHTLVCGGLYTVPKTVVNDASLYLMDNISLTSYFEIINGSFFAAEATGFDYESSRVTYINSTIYLPKPERNGTLKYSDLSAKSSRGITGIVTEANVQIDRNATVAAGTTLYVGGTTVFSGSYSITNYGNMYLMGRVDTSIASSNPFVFKDGSDSYIGTTSSSGIGTLSFSSFLEPRGNIYLENNLTVNGNNGTATVGNRYASLVSYGNLYVFGGITTQTSQGVLVQNGSTVSCGGNFTVGSAIYNYGKLIVNGNLIIVDNDYVTDKKESKSKNASLHHEGISIKNGASEGAVNAEMYIGGTQAVTLYGYIINSGKLYMNSSISIQGWNPSDAVKSVQAFTNYNKAKAHFNGTVYLNSNVLYNRQDAEFGCTGDLYFGGCIYNLGKLVATGKITNNEAGHTVNSLRYNNGSSKSIMNGTDLIEYKTYNQHTYPNAMLYCGGDMQLGASQSGGEAGSFISYGTSYIGGSLLDYTNKGNSYYITALWLMNNSNTFIGGNCFGGAGITVGANSIFMCDGDYVSKRSTKINIQTCQMYYLVAGNFTTCVDNDNGTLGSFDYTPAYFYVGGNMFNNVLGKGTWELNVALKAPENYSRDLDIYSNTNMFVGGSLIANSKVFMKQNVNLIVAGAKDLNSTSLNLVLGYSGHETVFNYILNAFTDSGERSALRALNDAGYFGSNPNTFYTSQLLDQNVCSTFVVNGDGTVTGTTKIRDMAKTYIYGDFYSRKYVELGKALDGADETEAKESGFFVNGVDSHDSYSYSRAAYMYVGGNYQCGGSQRLGKNYQVLTGVLAMITFNSEPTRIYASSTLKVKGSFLTTGYLTLRHDANIYSGKSLAAYKSIDVGSYSGVYVNGNCEAITSTVKIRDQVECVINGDLTALNAYIELGKQGDYNRGRKVEKLTETSSSNDACPCCDPEKKNENTICRDCTDNIFCECGCSDCKWKNGENTTGETAPDEDSTGTPEVDNTVASDLTQIADVSSEIEADASDTAFGGKFYIGGRVMSYNALNGYIKVYGYSQVIVGKYVFTPQYLTLRHNADLWVLPEMYSNITYKYKPYVSELTDDARIWQILIDRLKQFNYELKEATKFKNGSVYSLGQLTMNKNSSLMGSYDCFVLGQTNLMADTLVYLGHDFTCLAPSVNLGSVMDRIGWALDGKEGTAPAISVTGFTAQGSAKQAVRMVCTNTEAHGGRNYSMRVLYKNYDPAKNYKCDKCGAELNKKYFDANNEVSHPITLYADNDITLATTISLSSTYLVANKGDVKVANVYSSNECHCCDACTGNSSCQCVCENCVCDVDLRSLPNAIASYQGNIEYSALYSKISALFYAPTGGTNANGEETGVVKLDGVYQEIWGSVIGNRVKCNAFYMALHRFQNWRTLNLHLADPGKVYIISEKEFNNASNITNDDDEYDTNELRSTNPGGADMFFTKDVLDKVNSGVDDDD